MSAYLLLNGPNLNMLGIRGGLRSTGAIRLPPSKLPWLPTGPSAAWRSNAFSPTTRGI